MSEKNNSFFFSSEKYRCCLWTGLLRNTEEILHKDDSSWLWRRRSANGRVHDIWSSTFWMSWKEKHSSRSGLFFHSLRTVESDIQLPLLWTQTQRADGNKMWNVVCSSLGGRKNIKVFEDHQIEIRAVPQCDCESAGLYKFLKISQVCHRWRMEKIWRVLVNKWPKNWEKIQLGRKAWSINLVFSEYIKTHFMTN